MGASAVDAIVLGAGPAGLAAAIALRRLGATVVVVEPAPGRRRPASETLHPGVEPLIVHLGAEEALHRSTTARNEGVWVQWAAPLTFSRYGDTGGVPWRGFQVDRRRFDAGLRVHAERVGAAFLHGSPRRLLWSGQRPVALELGSQQLEADAFFDCTGPRRWLGRSVTTYASRSCRLGAHHGSARGDAHLLERPSITADHRGWTWLAEIAHGLHHWTRVTPMDSHPPRGWSPPDYAGLDVEFGGCVDVTWYRAATPVGPSWYLCGEAAARVDPVAGRGVLRAMTSAMMAAHSHARGTPAEYAGWFDEGIDSEMTGIAARYQAAGCADWVRAAPDVQDRASSRAFPAVDRSRPGWPLGVDLSELTSRS